jgi:hypothetical protein
MRGIFRPPMRVLGVAHVSARRGPYKEEGDQVLRGVAFGLNVRQARERVLDDCCTSGLRTAALVTWAQSATCSRGATVAARGKALRLRRCVPLSARAGHTNGVVNWNLRGLGASAHEAKPKAIAGLSVLQWCGHMCVRCMRRVACCIGVSGVATAAAPPARGGRLQ